MRRLTAGRALSRLLDEYPMVGDVILIAIGLVCVGFAIVALLDGSTLNDEGKLAWGGRAVNRLIVKIALATIFLGYSLFRLLT